MTPLRSIRRLIIALVVAVVTLRSGVAVADDEKRPRQDYGRPSEPTTADEVVAWPIRIALSPLWLISEFVIRQPVGVLVRWGEKHQVVETVEDLFTFGPERNITIYPSALFDFGLLPSVGFNLTWKDFFAKPNTLLLHAGTWGPDWIAVKATDSYAISKREHVALSAQLVRRSDNPFFGLGPNGKPRERSRYGAQSFEIAPEYERYLWRESQFKASAGARGLEFYDGSCCTDPSIERAIAEGRTTKPFGYGPAYSGGFQRASLSFDNRLPRPQPGSGIRVEGHEETFVNAGDSHGGTERSWIKYGGSIAGAWDVTGHNRVLGLTIDAELADAIRGKVPFTEQVALGGDELFPGYIRNRLIDRTATVAQLQYTWPVWTYLDGVLTLAAGNVWGSHFDDFKLKDSRLTGALGVRSNGARDSGFELTVGAGTDPLAEGFGVTSFRFIVGSHHGL